MTITHPEMPQASCARRPWVAVVLTILTPGLGHLYAGAPRRALGFWVLSLAAGVAMVAILSAVAILSVVPGSLLLVAGILGTPLIIGLIAWSAARTARNAGVDFVRRRYNRWWVYLGIVLAVAFLVQPPYLSVIKKTILQAYQIPSTSMEPTLLQGDFILAKPLRRAPERGDIVVYRRRGLVFMKRVVGLPADTLSMQNGTLLVNGLSVAEPYASHRHEGSLFDQDFLWQREYLAPGVDRATYHPTLTFWGPIVVPLRAYFVLGDNRGESADSRYTGFVPADSAIQRPTVIYLSRDRETGHIRWDRIGIVLNPRR
jgi:signal peptidase I